jgi:hypothetical protein
LQQDVAFPSATNAAILIWARQILRAVGGEAVPESAEEACRIAGSQRSVAYEWLDRLRAAASGLVRGPGRPPAPSKPEEDAAYREAVLAVTRTTRDLLLERTGLVQVRSGRRFYHDAYRRAVLELLRPGEPGALLDLATFADAAGVPLGTLKDWLREARMAPELSGEAGPPGGVTKSLSEAREQEPSGDDEVPSILMRDPTLAIILGEYPAWRGEPLVAFVRHLQEAYGQRVSRGRVATILQLAGLRDRPPRRRGATPWADGTYRRDLFPGAQWLGDGKLVTLELNGEEHTFNLEALLDVGSDAFTSVPLTLTEDAAAVLEAFQDAEAAAGGRPVGLSLDNRPSNHTDEVRDAVAPTELVRTTPGRGQSKAPLEGAFGLLEQTAPPLVVRGGDNHELARSILQLLVTIWAWTRNHRPRRRLGGRSPAEVYRSTPPPTPEELAEVLAHLRELKRRSDLARRTEEAKADPVRRQLLVEEMEALGLEDPDGRVATECARYSLEAILRGLAIFSAKRAEATIPPTADPARYLAGIIRRVNEQRELEAFAQHYLRLRLRANELSRAPLERAAADLRRSTRPTRLPQAFLDRALEVTAKLDFWFWREQLELSLHELSPAMRRALYTGLVERVGVSFDSPMERRSDLVALLGDVRAAHAAA